MTADGIPLEDRKDGVSSDFKHNSPTYTSIDAPIEVPFKYETGKGLLARIEKKGKYEKCENDYKIVWPVTPKDRPSVIHYAQMRAIAEVYNQSDVYIAASEIVCGNNTTNFTNALKSGLKNVSVNNVSIEKDKFGNIKKENLNRVLCKLSVNEIERYRKKNYPIKSDKSDTQNNEKIQKYVAPIYQFLTVAQAIESYDKDVLLVAGMDEKDQWSKLIKLYENGDLKTKESDKIHAIYLLLIPELKTKNDETVDQNEDEIKEILTCKNMDSLIDLLKSDDNARDWFETMFLDDRSLVGKEDGIKEIISMIKYIKRQD